jgi:hypothetical protein
MNKLPPTFDFGITGTVPRTDAQIARAKQMAVGGKRKRCTKGKNCSAACIQANMICMVDLPWVVSAALSNVKQMVQSGGGAGGSGGAKPMVQWAGGGAGGSAPAPKGQTWTPNLPAAAPAAPAAAPPAAPPPKPTWQKEQEVKKMFATPKQEEDQLKFNLKVAKNKGTPEQIAEATKALKDFKDAQKKLQASPPATPAANKTSKPVTTVEEYKKWGTATLESMLQMDAPNWPNNATTKQVIANATEALKQLKAEAKANAAPAAAPPAPKNVKVLPVDDYKKMGLIFLQDKVLPEAEKYSKDPKVQPVIQNIKKAISELEAEAKAKAAPATPDLAQFKLSLKNKTLEEVNDLFKQNLTVEQHAAVVDEIVEKGKALAKAKAATPPVTPPAAAPAKTPAASPAAAPPTAPAPAPSAPPAAPAAKTAPVVSAPSVEHYIKNSTPKILEMMLKDYIPNMADGDLKNQTRANVKEALKQLKAAAPPTPPAAAPKAPAATPTNKPTPLIHTAEASKPQQPSPSNPHGLSQNQQITWSKAFEPVTEDFWTGYSSYTPYIGGDYKAKTKYLMSKGDLDGARMTRLLGAAHDNKVLDGIYRLKKGKLTPEEVAKLPKPLQDMIAKHGQPKFRGFLTQVANFTGNDYSAMRAVMKGRIPTTLKWMTNKEEQDKEIAKIRKNAEKVQQFLETSTVRPVVPKFRGIPADDARLQNYINLAKTGGSFTEDAMNSWSSRPSSTYMFMRNANLPNGGHKILFRTMNKNGTSVDSISQNQGEAEILTPGNSSYKVVGYKEVTDPETGTGKMHVFDVIEY